MKINVIIQARYNSKRLPNKVSALIGKRSLLEMVVDRCVAAGAGKVIVAGFGIDPVYVDIGGVPIYLGVEEPAARFIGCLREYPCDAFVRVCADSPFIDPLNIALVADKIKDGADYYIFGSPNGNQAEGFNTQAFFNAEPNMQGEEREHLGMWFRRRDRLTVDTHGDLERARLIVSRMTKPHTEYSAAECLALLRE